MPDSYDYMDIDRTRGIITSSDREYLLGRLDVEPQSQRERVIRGRIRERVRQALVDFSLLFRYLEDRDLHLIFDEESIPEDRLPNSNPHPISRGAAHATGLFYRDDPESMEAFVEGAIELDLRERGWLASPEVQIQENRKMNAEELLNRVKETGEVWPEEKVILERQGLVRPTEWAGLTEHHTGSRDDGIPEGITEPEEAIEYLTLPASGGSRREEQRKAVETAVDYIRREGETTLAEIQDAVFPVYPAGYGDAEVWLRELLHPALATLPGIAILLRGEVILTDTHDDHDGLDAPARRHREHDEENGGEQGDEDQDESDEE